jgi:hypothetical protein
MKYLVVKGYLGFGDRLESLKMAVKYAMHYNLQIYVDWRDPMWSHGGEDFYTYFKLINVPVLASLDDIPADATFYPPMWKDCLHEQMTYEFGTKHMGDNIDIGLMDKPYDADVVVLASCGYRKLFPDSSFFADVFRVVDDRVLANIRHHKSKYPVEKSWGIHIRGTDNVSRHKRELCVQSIACRMTMMGGLNSPNMVVVSDDKEMTALLKNFYPNAYVISDLSVQTSLVGNHNLGKDALHTSKDNMNVAMLTDFFILASCAQIFTTVKGSRFYQEAYRLHPIVDKLMAR